MAFDSSVHELSGYLTKFHMKVTDDVTAQVIGQTSEYLSQLVLPGKVAVSNRNKADEMAWTVRDTSKHPLKPLVTLC